MDLASIKKFFASLTLQKLVPVILIVVIGLLLVKLLLKLFDRVLERSRLERTMFSFLRAVMRALLYTILVLVAASSLGVDDTLRAAFPLKKVSSSHSKGETVLVTAEEIPEDALRRALEPTGYKLVSVQSAPYVKRGLFHRG